MDDEFPGTAFQRIAVSISGTSAGSLRSLARRQRWSCPGRSADQPFAASLREGFAYAQAFGYGCATGSFHAGVPGLVRLDADSHSTYTD
jgi:hypothetical protein